MGRKKLFFWPEGLVFGKDRGDGLRGYGPTDQGREFLCVMDMRYLEADDQPETETGDTD
jgi:hypothetical protein